jgi:phosphatidate cytidylyltransferase
MGRHSAPRRGMPRSGDRSTGVPQTVPPEAIRLPDVVLGAAPVDTLARADAFGLQAPPGPAVPSRAGRNLPLAVGVGLGLGLLVVVPLFLYPFAFVVVVALAVGVGCWEVVRALGGLPARPPLVPLLVGSLGMIALAWRTGPESLFVGLVVTVVAAMLWRLGDGSGGYQRDVTAAAFVAAYVPFLAGFCILMLRAPSDGQLRVVAFVATVVCSDVGGYVAGVLFGRHPMAPTVSPKKSWEGMAGSALACAAAGAAFLTLVFDRPAWEGVVFGVAIATAATLGDLAESMVKRDLGIKDMGTLLPGHGGVMDRLDSLLVAAPVAYLVLSAFVAVK